MDILDSIKYKHTAIRGFTILMRAALRSHKL